MRTFTHQRTPQTCDEIWFVEHPPVFTQGQAGKAEHIIDSGDIPIIQSDRGGQVTYHGPGQIIAYLLIDLRRGKWKIRSFVHAIENIIIKTLADYDITGNVRDNAPGVYVNDAKICALGLRVRHGYSYHGLAFNIKMDLQPFSRINPCGFYNLAVTQLSDLCPNIDPAEVSSRLAKYLQGLTTNADYIEYTPRAI